MVLPPGLPSANNIINNATTTASAAIWTLGLKFWISSFEFEFPISIWHSKTKFWVEFWIQNLPLFNVFYSLYQCLWHTLRSMQCTQLESFLPWVRQFHMFQGYLQVKWNIWSKELRSKDNVAIQKSCSRKK